MATEATTKPDPNRPLTADEIEKYQKARAREIKAIRKDDDFERFARFALKIKTKSGKIVPFQLNPAQKLIWLEMKRQLKETGRVRLIICKARQLGCTTLIQAIFFWLTSQKNGQTAHILSHQSDSTSHIFDMCALFYKLCDPEFKPVIDKSNVRQMSFLNHSKITVATAAGTGNTGRGSTFNLFHASEAAYYPANNIGGLITGAQQALFGGEGSMMIIESTANGCDNYFHTLWQHASSKPPESDFVPLFLGWNLDPSYSRPCGGWFKPTKEELQLKKTYDLTNTQLNWRRHKIKEFSIDCTDGEQLMNQEFPLSAAMSFILSSDRGLIHATDVIRAREAKDVVGVGPLIVACDPARYGDDSTVIARRRGRHIYPLEVYKKRDTMEISGILNRIILDEKPAAVFIDCGGLGVGIFDFSARRTSIFLGLFKREAGRWIRINTITGGQRPGVFWPSICAMRRCKSRCRRTISYRQSSVVCSTWLTPKAKSSSKRKAP